jgi:hypothetical protein
MKHIEFLKNVKITGPYCMQGAHDPGQAGGAGYQAQAGGTSPLLRQLHHRFTFTSLSFTRGDSISTLSSKVTIEITPKGRTPSQTTKATIMLRTIF